MDAPSGQSVQIQGRQVESGFTEVRRTKAHQADPVRQVAARSPGKTLCPS